MPMKYFLRTMYTLLLFTSLLHPAHSLYFETAQHRIRAKAPQKPAQPSSTVALQKCPFTKQTITHCTSLLPGIIDIVIKYLPLAPEEHPYQSNLSCTEASQQCKRTRQALETIQFSPEIIDTILLYLPCAIRMILPREDAPRHPLSLIYWKHIGGPTCKEVRKLIEEEMTPAQKAKNTVIYYRYAKNKNLVDRPPYSHDSHVLPPTSGYTVIGVTSLSAISARIQAQTSMTPYHYF